MSAYETLAASYDGLTYDVPYEKVLQYCKRLFVRYGAKPQSVLDLACGTGSLAVLFAEENLRVYGVDCSEQMLTEAYEKSMQMENPPYWILQKMQNLRLAEPVDACVCCLDSINYLTKPKDVRKTFRRVYDSLTDGGVFIFDVNSPYKLRSLDDQVFLDENEDVYCVWRSTFSEKRNICTYGMDIFERNGDAWERSFEQHEEYAYTPEELCAYLREAGFTKIESFGDRVLRAPKQDELRIYFAAKKEKL